MAIEGKAFSTIDLKQITVNQGRRKHLKTGGGASPKRGKWQRPQITLHITRIRLASDERWPSFSNTGGKVTRGNWGCGGLPPEKFWISHPLERRKMPFKLNDAT